MSVVSLHARSRTAIPRRYLMCPPTHFEVRYTINPWMDPSVPVDRDRAIRQWEALRATYRSLGHTVETIAAAPGLPDMVFAANGATVVGGRALGARFRHAERAAEADLYAAWLRDHGVADVVPARAFHEGEGDLLAAGDVVLAGTGFRSSPQAHAEAAALFGCEVVSLELVDPRYYHLDTALCVLDDETVAYLPEAFSPASRLELERRYPDAIRVRREDAEVLGLNAVSDGRHVVVVAEAERFAAQLEASGFAPVAVEMDELRKAGGGPKCCTMELRPATLSEDATEVPA